MAIIYGFKVNLSVAIVAMVNQTALKSGTLDPDPLEINQSSPGVCKPLSHNSTLEEPVISNDDGPLVWTEPEQGLVLGSYFWGYLITQVPGGRISELYGGKWVFWTAVFLNILAILLSPICSMAGYQYLIGMRIMMGLGAGVTFPAMNVLIAKWSPKDERSTISSVVYGGTSLGTVLSILTSGLIAGYFGWEWVFYIHGGLACIWLILWAIFISDDPQNNRFVSAEEKKVIAGHSVIEYEMVENNVIIEDNQVFIPWKSILFSVPFWALCISHTLNNFGWYMLLVELPLFMSNGLGFNIKDNALLSTLPFLANWLFTIFYSSTMDTLARKGILKTVHVRKISMTIASLVPAACLVGVCIAACETTTVVRAPLV